MKIDISWYDPYKKEVNISSLNQLFGLASIVNSTNDSVIPQDSFKDRIIHLVSSLDFGKYIDEWCPIGNENKLFEGTFEASGVTISGFSPKKASDEFALFGAIGANGEVRGVSLKGDIIGNHYIAGIAVINGGLISACNVVGNIQAKSTIGGISATNYGTIARSSFRGTIQGVGQYVGGIAGVNQNDVGDIKDCFSTAPVTGYSMIGGIAGYSAGTGIKNSFNTGNISAEFGSAGGIVGANAAGSSVINCYNAGSVSVKQDEVGGISGKNVGNIVGCNNTGKISGILHVGGIVGSNLNGKVNTCKNRGNVNGKSEVGGVTGSTKTGEIKNCSNDADVNATFGLIGGVVGTSKWGSVVGSFNSGSIASKDKNVGGIVGQCQYGDIVDCSNSGSVTGSGYVGGIVGTLEARGSLSRCNNSGVSRATSNVGGIAGLVCGNVTDSYSTGSVYGADNMSSLVGQSTGGLVQNCYSIGVLHPLS